MAHRSAKVNAERRLCSGNRPHRAPMMIMTMAKPDPAAARKAMRTAGEELQKAAKVGVW